MGCREFNMFTAPVPVVLLVESPHTRDCASGHWGMRKPVGDLCQRRVHADQPGNCRKTGFTRPITGDTPWQPVWLEGYSSPS